MTQLRLIILILLLGLGLFGLLWQLLRHNKLRTVYAVVWFITAGLFFAVVFLAHALVQLADFFQVAYAPAFILGLGLLFTLILVLFLTVTLSSLARRATQLAQLTALLQWQQEQTLRRLQQAEQAAGKLADRVAALEQELQYGQLVYSGEEQSLPASEPVLLMPQTGMQMAETLPNQD